MPEQNTPEPARRLHPVVLPDSARDLGVEPGPAPARTPGGEAGLRAARERRFDPALEPPAAGADPVALD